MLYGNNIRIKNVGSLLRSVRWHYIWQS